MMDPVVLREEPGFVGATEGGRGELRGSSERWLRTGGKRRLRWIGEIRLGFGF